MHAVRRIINTPTSVADPVHWTVPFSIGRYWSAWTSRQTAVATDYAINVLTSGAYRRRDGLRGRLVDSSQLAMINAGEEGDIECPCPGDRRGIYIRIHWDLVPQLLEAAQRGVGSEPTRLLPRRAMPLTPGLAQQWYGLWRDACAGLTDDVLYERALAVCLEALAAPPPSAPRKRAVRERVEAVQLMLLQEPAQRTTLDQLAERVGWSRFQLCRHFAAVTGVRVHHYRELLRVSAAVEQLGRGTPDLSALAPRLGYPSHSHFSSRFRRMLGSPPSHFRAQM